jgi:hypothetical protein
LQIIGETAAVPMFASIAQGRVPLTEEPANRRHQSSTKSALAMPFSIFASWQLVEEFRRTSEARDFDRLIAG